MRKIPSAILCFLFYTLIGISSIYLFCNFDFFRFLDEFLYAAHFPVKEPKSSRIIIIDIDDNTINAYGKLPWKNREIFANMINTLSKYKPKIIAIDLLFDVIRDIEGDHHFAQAVAKAENVILASPFDMQNFSIIEPYPELLLNALGTGYTNISSSSSHIGVVSVMMDFKESNKNRRKYSHFVFEIVSKYLKMPYCVKDDGISYKLGEIHLPSINPFLTDFCKGSSDFPIYYVGNKEAFLTFSFHNVLINKVELDKIKDSLILIGVTAKGCNDHFNTPLSIWSNKPTPGVIIWANALYSILNKKLIRPLWGIEYTIIIIIILAIINKIIKNCKRVFSIVLISFLLFFYVFFSQALFKFWLIYINIGPVVIAVFSVIFLRCIGRWVRFAKIS